MPTVTAHFILVSIKRWLCVKGAIAGMKLPLSVGVLGIPSFGLRKFRSRMGGSEWMVPQWAMQYVTRMLDLKYMYSTGLMMQCWSQHCKANDKKGPSLVILCCSGSRIASVHINCPSHRLMA